MDKEMIDRISKAILETPNASDYATLVSINVIKAMSWPTKNMMLAGEEQKMIDDSASSIYMAMIDSIIDAK